MSKEKFKLSKTELNKAWKDSFSKKDEFVKGFEPEDGRYMVAVTNAMRTESKSSGRDQISWEYTFLDGDYKGKNTWSYDGLDRPESIPYVMRRIARLGFEVPESLDDLEAVLKKITKKQPKVRIVVKTNGDFRNINIDRLLDEDETEAEEETEDVAEAETEEKEEPAKSKVSKEAPEPEEPEEDEDEEGDTLDVGMRVRCFDESDEEVGKGTVTAIDEDTLEVIVKLDTGKKAVFSVNNLRLLPKEEPKKKGLKVGR